MDHQSLIKVRDLRRSFGELQAVRGINLDVSRGEVLGFLGPNGAGKSTTMRMLAGTLVPDTGSIEIDGLNMRDSPNAAKARIGYLPEQPPLYKELTVDEYLTFATRLRGLRGKTVATSVASARQRCGLDEVGRRLIANLSKGYQQRVGIAQAIVHSPKIVILDEPTAGLDPIQILEIRALIRELGDAHCVILSTHILAEVHSICDRVTIVNEGAVVLDESLEALSQATASAHRIELRQPPQTNPFEELAGVESVQRNDDGTWLVHHDGTPTTVDALATCAGAYGLVEFARQRRTLEDLFVQLTMGDAGGGNDAKIDASSGVPSC
jgi:ABC-2 type transport system ATP-binding protein